MVVGAPGKGPRRPIRLLPEEVILKIAAGEVVERPASVVKELLENALDAGATHIEIRIADGGRRSISVTDNGFGMSEEEARLALQRHATSKIENTQDLFQISTLGFRGEALAAIAAISQLDLITRNAEATTGTRLHCEGGEIRYQEPIGTPVGTTLSVSNLFFNTPARKKFLRSRNTEVGHIDLIVRRAALIAPEQTFLLESDGEMVFHLPGTASLLDRVAQIYGREFASQLRPLEARETSLKLRGFVSDPHQTYARPSEIWFYVNGRPVRDRMIQAALSEGYRTALMERRYPFALLLLDIDPAGVDVNVHPTKAEVRFSDSQPIFQLVSRAVAQAVRRPEAASIASPSPQPWMAAEATSTYSPQTSFLETRTERTPAALPLELLPISETFASLHYLGTIDDTYLVLRGDGDLVLIDQHAAHERVQFERFRTPIAERQRPEAQNLLLPITMELSPSRLAALTSSLETLARLGFEIDPFGEKTVVVRSVPAILGNRDPRPLLLDLADDGIADLDGTAWNQRLDEVVSRIACHSAVRAHDPLSPTEIRSLLEAMDRVDLATNCPHGRPTYIRLRTRDLERFFHRV